MKVVRSKSADGSAVMRSALLHIISKESTYGTNSRVVVGHSVMVEKERSRAGESDDGRANLLFCCGGCTPEDAPGLSTAVAATSDVTGDCAGAPRPPLPSDAALACRLKCEVGALERC